MKKTSLLSLLLIFVLAACSSAAGQTQATFTPLVLSTTTAPPPVGSTTVPPTASPALSTAVTLVAPSPSPSSSPTPSYTSTPDGMVLHPAGTVVVPILLFHRISNEGGGRYTISVDGFQAIIKLLKDGGYQTVTVSELADVIRSGGMLPDKPVVITFDDGYEETYQNAFPIMQEAGYKATAYIITGTLGTKLSYGYMQDEELKALAAAGWEIGSHGVTHTDLKKTKLGVGNEMEQSKKTLEDRLGVKVRSFSYPFGYAPKDIQEQAAKAGYDSGVGLDTLNTHGPDQIFYLNRREIYRSLPMFSIKKLLLPSQRDNIIATQTAAATPGK